MRKRRPHRGRCDCRRGARLQQLAGTQLASASKSSQATGTGGGLGLDHASTGSGPGPRRRPSAKVIKAFNKVYPNVKVNYKPVGNNVPTVLATAIAGGHPPDMADIAQPGSSSSWRSRAT